MPRTKEANQRIRTEQHTKILEAALSVFARQGMAATITEIAAAADMSYGLVYRYFVSKEALLLEVVEKVMGDSLKTIKLALEVPGTPGERLQALLTQILAGVREHPEFILLVQHMLSEKAERHHPVAAGQTYRPALNLMSSNEAAQDHLRELAQEQSRTYRAVLKQLIIEGQASGEIAHDDPDQLVTAITSYVAGLAQSALRQAPEEFKRTFPALEIILRIFIPREKESHHA